MVKFNKHFVLIISLAFVSCKQIQPLILEIHNPSDFNRVDEAVLLDMHTLALPIPEYLLQTCVLSDGVNEIPYQLVDENQDEVVDGILLMTDLAAGESKSISITYGEKLAPNSVDWRVQAELSVKSGGKFEGKKYVGGQFMNVTSLDLPAEHTDHSTYIRYEGPGWESDKVGYRFYLDWRNAIDIFGKSKPDLVLQNVGQDGFDSYHEPSDWGMDILKVGESLGIGSIGMWSNGLVHRVDSSAHTSVKILSNGPLEAKILTNYKQWQVDGKPYDLRSILSIQAGSRITKHVLQINPVPDNLCTGLVKDPDVEVFTSSDPASQWQFMASYGAQSLAGDNLGMAVLFQKSANLGFESDKESDILLLKPEGGTVTYYFLAAWEGEENGIKDLATFKTYLLEEIEKLNQPTKGQ